MPRKKPARRPARKTAKAKPRQAKRPARKPANALKAPAPKKAGGSIFDVVPHKDDDSEPRFESGKDDFLEDEEHPETPEDLELKMHTGQKPYDVYTAEGRDELIEDDEVEDWEQGFAAGAAGKGKGAVCGHCRKPLPSLRDRHGVVEREFAHGVIYFCSDGCAEKYARKFKG
jgi:hypothetical protein